MINKKNLLGRVPAELGVKDAIHVAIVSVRAGMPMRPGSACVMADGVAVPGKGLGVVDPFRSRSVYRGETFWMLLDQSQIPSVQHTWEHPAIDFAPGQEPVARNSVLMETARLLDVTYDQLMSAIDVLVETGKPTPHPKPGIGSRTLAIIWENEKWDTLGEWVNETGHEFSNFGTECCPEYEYPEGPLFIQEPADA